MIIKVQDTQLTSNKEGFDSPWDRHFFMKNISRFFTKDFIAISLLCIIYIFTIKFYHNDIFGYWESLSVYQIFEPGADLILPVIQEMGNTVGNYGINYPFILISKYFALLFGLDFFSVKYLFILYSLFFIVFFYFVIKKLFDKKISFISTIIIVTNPYFVYLSIFITIQQITLLLIFLNIFLFLNKENSKIFLWLLSLSISLLLMNYIYGRYVLLIILIYFYSNDLLKEKLNTNTFFKVNYKYFKILSISCIILIILFPPNISILFSKELFLPSLAFGQETILNSGNKIYEVFFLNLKFLLNNFFFNFNNLHKFNLINGEAVNILHLFLLIFFIIGFIVYLKKNLFSFLNILFFYYLFLLCLSNAYINSENEILSTLSVYRIYLLFPLFVVYSSLGIVFFCNLVSKKNKINLSLCSLIITICIFFQIVELNKSKKIFTELNKQYQNNFFGYKNLNTKNKLNLKKRLDLDFNLKIKELSRKIDIFINTNDIINDEEITFVNLKKDIELEFKSYPSQLKIDEDGKYIFHIFTTLYLNSKSNIDYSFLYKASDKNSFKKQLNKYSTNKYFLKEDSSFKNLSKYIAQYLSKLINLDDVNNYRNNYEIYKINYFKKPRVILIFNDKELNFVKNRFTTNIKTILLSDLIK